MAKKKPGPKPTGKTKARQLGRVKTDTWEFWQLSAAKAGMSFTKWATLHLNNAAEADQTPPISLEPIGTEPAPRNRPHRFQKG